MEQSNFDVPLRAFVWWDDDAKVFVSRAPMLGMASQGTTEESAERALRSGIALWFEHCARRGILASALEKRGVIIRIDRRRLDSQHDGEDQFRKTKPEAKEFTLYLPVKLSQPGAVA